MNSSAQLDDAAVQPGSQPVLPNGSAPGWSGGEPSRTAAASLLTGAFTLIRPEAGAATHSTLSRFSAAPCAVHPSGTVPPAKIQALELPPRLPFAPQRPGQVHAVAPAAPTAATARAVLAVATGHDVSHPWPLPIMPVLNPPTPAVAAEPSIGHASDAVAGVLAAPQAAAPVAAADAAPSAQPAPAQPIPPMSIAVPHTGTHVAAHSTGPAAAASTSMAAIQQSAGRAAMHAQQTAALAAVAPQRSSRTQLPPASPGALLAQTNGSASGSPHRQGTSFLGDLPGGASRSTTWHAAPSGFSSYMPVLPGELPMMSSFMTGHLNSADMDRMALAEDPGWLASPSFSVLSTGPFPEASLPYTAPPASAAAAPVGTEEDNGTEAVSTLAAQPAAPAAPTASAAPEVAGAMAASKAAHAQAAQRPMQELQEEPAAVVAATAMPHADRPSADAVPGERHSSPPLNGPSLQVQSIDPDALQTKLQAVPVQIVQALEPFFQLPAAPGESGRGGRRRVRPAINFTGGKAGGQRSMSLKVIAATATAAAQRGAATAAPAAAPAADTSETVTASPFKSEPPEASREVSSLYANERASVRRKRSGPRKGQAPAVRATGRGAGAAGARAIFMPDGPLQDGAPVVYYDIRAGKELLRGQVKLAHIRYGQFEDSGGILCSHCNQVCMPCHVCHVRSMPCIDVCRAPRYVLRARS